jgi:ComF family protein
MHTLPFISKEACRLCRAKMVVSEKICGQCLTRTYAFDQVIVPFYYKQPITGLLFQLKFHERLASIPCFTYFLLKQIKQFRLHLPELIMPVPLHKKRLKKRGYNQSMALARSLSLALNVPVDRYTCQRVKFTQPQQKLMIKDRAKNVRKAFCCKKLTVSSVAIIDDVITTGATAHAMAKCLKRAGAKTVYVWCCARA